MRLYPFDTPIKSLYFRSFVVSVLLARFHFKVIRKSLYLDAKSPCVYTVYGRKISLRLVQLNLMSLGTKEIFLAIVLLCKLSCG